MSPAWSMVEFAARPLSSDEREAILGDSLEAGESAWQTLCGVLGLMLRRHLLLWKSWRPWFAALFAILCSLLLMYVSISVTCTSERLLGYKLGHWAPTGNEGLPMLLCHVFLLIAWSWTSGFAVGSISPRTLGWSAAVCVFMGVRFGMYEHLSVSPFYALLFVAPAIWGVRQGLRRLRLPFRTASLLAATMIILTTAAWIDNALWIFNWLLLWPALFLVATATRSGATKGSVHASQTR
jgi:hypothetical protein